MHAKVVVGHIRDLALVDRTVGALYDGLISDFLAAASSEQGYWLLRRSTGQVMEITCWRDLAALQAASAEHGARRAAFAEQFGISVGAVISAEVVGYAEGIDDECPRWARSSWVCGLTRDHDSLLRSLHPGIAAGQAAAPGFASGYWLADYNTGNGIGLSLWGERSQMRKRDNRARAVRSQFEASVECKVETVEKFRVVAAADRGDGVTIDLLSEIERSSPVGQR